MAGAEDVGSGLSETSGWNHNLAYENWVLRQVPRGCGRALDVGCGRGRLALALAEKCATVVGLDRDSTVLPASTGRVRFIAGDVMTVDVGEFDCVTLVAALHHLPLREGLARLRELVAPGGVLVVVGLYRLATVQDFAVATVARVASWARRCVLGAAAMDAAVCAPRETLTEIRAAVCEVLRGAEVRRRFFFRYTLVWVRAR